MDASDTRPGNGETTPFDSDRYPDLGPERTREVEAGLDWAFLDGRLSTEFTYYNQTTSDALFAVRQVPSLGFTSSQLENVGKIRNSGIELGIQAIVVDGNSFGFDLGGSIADGHRVYDSASRLTACACLPRCWTKGRVRCRGVR